MTKRAKAYSADDPFGLSVAETAAAYGASPKAPDQTAAPETRFHDPSLGVKLILGDCIQVMAQAPDECVDLIFADPPYFLSNNGITCHAGRMVSVNKGKWDASKGVAADHEFVLNWLTECRRLLRPHGTLWVSGTLHIIYSVGYAMQQLGYKILNDIVWEKPNPPPHLACRYFAHSTEIILWARKSDKAKHYFNYALMKEVNGGKQMKNVWRIAAPDSGEKRYGKHPTQKPVKLLERIVLAGSRESDLVLDPFMGSGTTGVAAVRLGRRFVGVEMEPEFMETAVKRVGDEIGERKGSLFARATHGTK